MRARCRPVRKVKATAPWKCMVLICNSNTVAYYFCEVQKGSIRSRGCGRGQKAAGCLIEIAASYSDVLLIGNSSGSDAYRVTYARCVYNPSGSQTSHSRGQQPRCERSKSALGVTNTPRCNASREAHPGALALTVLVERAGIQLADQVLNITLWTKHSSQTPDFPIQDVTLSSKNSTAVQRS